MTADVRTYRRRATPVAVHLAHTGNRAETIAWLRSLGFPAEIEKCEADDDILIRGRHYNRTFGGDGYLVFQKPDHLEFLGQEDLDARYTATPDPLAALLAGGEEQARAALDTFPDERLAAYTAAIYLLGDIAGRACSDRLTHQEPAPTDPAWDADPADARERAINLGRDAADDLWRTTP